ncbi:MAG: HAD family hydrolase [bacterium]|nr:HAD family hydrolase [bacterium]
MSSTHRIEVVLLDMGGVLIPEAPGYEGAARDPELIARVEAFGIEDPSRFTRERARSVRQAYRDLKGSYTQPDVSRVFADQPPELAKLLLRAFRLQATRPPYGHSRSVVAELARTHRLGLVSNTVIPGDHHARALRRVGLLQHFECAVWSANFGRRKPDPTMIHHVLEQLGVPARRALMVGDKLHTDVLAAQRAGVRSVYLRKRGAPHQGPAQPDFTIQHLGALPKLVRDLS